jgi:hypothetical protein
MVQKLTRKEFLKALAGVSLSLPIFIAACANPAAGKKNAAVSLRLAFSEAMNEASVLGAAKLVVGSNTISPTSANWIDASTVLLAFGSCELDQVSKFTIAAGATDLAGNALAPYALAYS